MGKLSALERLLEYRSDNGSLLGPLGVVDNRQYSRVQTL